jgi:hypothetical protein
MSPLPGRTAALLVVCAAALTPAASAQPAGAADQRTATIRALEALIATGTPVHGTHDAGESLQRAVDDAIRTGDREVEQLAVRAAAPLTARVSRPVSPDDDLPSLEINALTVLSLPRPLQYSAQIHASLDGGPLFHAWDQKSGTGAGFRVDLRLGAAAARPGAHHLRLRAHLTFGDPERPSSTEVRDLPELFYAIYDGRTPSLVDARRFIYSPAAAAASDIDPVLPGESFPVWLSGILSARRAGREPAPQWVSHYCSERTEEAGSPPDQTAICSVIYFQAPGGIGQVWFRTADVRVEEDRIDWVPRSPARLEALIIGDSAPEYPRLSMLPGLLDTDAALLPKGDVAIDPSDIVITPPIPRRGRASKVVVTVHNRGQADLHKVLVLVSHGHSPTTRGTVRQFVVDIPAANSVNVTLDAQFPQGYGVLMAMALQVTEHAPSVSSTYDPTPTDACAFRLVNARGAPSGYLASFGDMSGCAGK